MSVYALLSRDLEDDRSKVIVPPIVLCYISGTPASRRRSLDDSGAYYIIERRITA